MQEEKNVNKHTLKQDSGRVLVCVCVYACGVLHREALFALGDFVTLTFQPSSGT